MREEGYEKIERGGWPIENYGKKEQKAWLDNTVTVPDPHPVQHGTRRKSTYKNRFHDIFPWVAQFQAYCTLIRLTISIY